MRHKISQWPEEKNKSCSSLLYPLYDISNTSAVLYRWNFGLRLQRMKMRSRRPRTGQTLSKTPQDSVVIGFL